MSGRVLFFLLVVFQQIFPQFSACGRLSFFIAVARSAVDRVYTARWRWSTRWTCCFCFFLRPAVTTCKVRLVRRGQGRRPTAPCREGTETKVAHNNESVR